MKTKGQRALAKIATDRDGGQSGIARDLRLNPSSVSFWVRGISRPEPHFRTALKILLGIPEDDWLTDKERASIAHVRALPVAQDGGDSPAAAATEKAS